MGALLQRTQAFMPQLSRYWVVSVSAMSLDWAVFLLLANGRVAPAAAGVLGYAAGLMLHYMLSVRFVFDAAATAKSPARLFTEFTLSGLAGMAVTGSIIAVATALGIGAVPAKACSIIASFAVVYTIRRTIVFARCETMPAPARN